MKRILACSILLVSYPAFSFDWGLKDPEGVKDLMYFPKANTFFASTETKAEENEFTYDYQGRKFSKVTNTQATLSQTVNYAILDNLKFGLDFSYNSKNETKTEYGPASSSNGTTVKEKSPGLLDPEFQASFLLKKQNESSPMISGTILVSPKTGKAKDANGEDHKGNSYRGGSFVQASVDMGKKYTDGQWMLGLYYRGYSKQESKDAKDDSVTTQDAYRTYTLGGGWQWDWEKFSLGLGLTYEFNSEIAGNSDGTPYTLDSTMTTTVIVKPIWNVVANTVSIYADVRGYVAQDLDYSEGSGASKTTLNVKDLTGSSFALGAIYSF